MAFYECTFVARADLSRADVQKLTDTFSKIVTDGEGTIVKTEYWGLRTLAYKINKMNKGHYTMLGLDCSPATLKELERNMGINEDLIRTLTVRVETMDATPTVMLQSKSGDSYETNAA
ncbi:MAG: 30S ribosomal protein S6 [Pseudomonadota bacterium]